MRADYHNLCVDGKQECVGGGEYKHLDFVYYESDPATARVVIEHENLRCKAYKRGSQQGTIRRLQKLREDFLKTCLFPSPLRVAIGYGENQSVALGDREELVKMDDQGGVKQAPGFETLLVMGWPQKGNARDWHLWIKDQKGWSIFSPDKVS